MDKQLLKALDNLSDALEKISEILKSKKGGEGEKNSDVTKALQSGDFLQEIKEINVGVKSIKKDTQEILNQQKTILSMSKKKESDKKTGEFESDPKKESSIKKGVGTILLIAVAVLAIGMAFKIVGKIDFLSVIGLALAITIISVAFSKVAALKFNLNEAKVATLTMVMIAAALTVSSWILKLILPIGAAQLFTGIAISVMFAVMGPRLVGLIETLAKIKKIGGTNQQIKQMFMVLVGLSAAITVSSWILRLISPMGIAQVFTGIAIAGMFAIMGPKAVRIIESLTLIKLGGGGPKQIAQMFMILVGLSAAITVSSWVLRLITPISLGQMITGIAIATMFYVMSGTIPKLAAAVVIVSKLMSKKDILLMPILMAAFSGAITVSSWMLQYVRPMGLMQMITGIAITAMFWVVSNFLPKLALAIVIVGKIMGKKDIAFMPIIMVAFSAAIMASSWLLGFVKPMGFLQMLTAIVITAMFWLIAKFLPDVAMSMVIVDRILGKNKVFLIPLIFTAMSLAIAVSGYLLSSVPALGWKQMVSVIVIGLVFAALSYVMQPMAIGLVIMDKFLGKGKMFLIPLVYVAIATALTLSSLIMSKFADIPFIILLKILAFSVILTVAVVLVGIAAIFLSKFVGMSTIMKMPFMFSLVAASITLSSMILSKYSEMTFLSLVRVLVYTIVLAIASVILGIVALLLDRFVGMKTIFKMPFMFVLIATAITLSSIVLSKFKDISIATMLKIGIFSVVLAIAVIALGIAAKVLTMLGGPMTYIKGGLVILILAATIVASSFILNAGKYGNYPSIKWVLGVGLSLAAFGVAAAVLGLAVFGPQALIFAAGLAATIGVAGTIVAVSLVLSKGKYTAQGMLPWAMSVALLYGAFVPAIVVLGALGLAGGVLKFFGAEDPFEKAKKMMIQIASTIVQVSFILGKGKYVGGPTKAWAEGIAIALGAFSSVYSMLMANAVMKIFGGGGVGPDDFAKAIKTVSLGIMYAAELFASPKNKGVWLKGPPKEWAEGVGMAIGAFAPVLKILSDGAIISIFGGKGVDAAAMKGAIVSISEGIVEAARYFGDPKKLKGVVWSKSYPDKAWGEGVGAALNAFAPVFTALQGKGWFTSGAEVIGEMKMGILQMADAIVKVGLMLNGWVLGPKNILIPGKTKPDFKNFPSKDWAEGISTTVIKFNALFGLLSRQKGGIQAFTTQSMMMNVVFMSISNIAHLIKKNEAAFKAMIPAKWIEGVSQSAIGYAMLTRIIESIYTKKEVYKYPFSSERKETSFVDTNAMGIMGKLMIAMVTTAQILFKNRKAFEALIPTPWIAFLSRQAIGFALLTRDLEKLLTTTEKITKIDSNIFSTTITKTTIKQEKDMSIVARTAANMALVARILHSNSKFFQFKIAPDYMKNVGSNILAFAILTKKISEMQRGGGIGGMLNRLIGNDPMSQMADGMVKIAKAYDILARSLARFGNAISTIDGEKVSIIRRLTGNIAVLASMDAEMFDRVMSVLESKASVFSKLIEADKKSRPSVGDRKGGGGEEGKEGKKAAVSAGIPKKTKTEQQLDEIITQLKAINYNTSGIDEWLASQNFAPDVSAKL